MTAGSHTLHRVETAPLTLLLLGANFMIKFITGPSRGDGSGWSLIGEPQLQTAKAFEFALEFPDAVAGGTWLLLVASLGLIWINAPPIQALSPQAKGLPSAHLLWLQDRTIRSLIPRRERSAESEQSFLVYLVSLRTTAKRCGVLSAQQCN
jgi:hypothetical protein